MRDISPEEAFHRRIASTQSRERIEFQLRSSLVMYAAGLLLTPASFLYGVCVAPLPRRAANFCDRSCRCGENNGLWWFSTPRSTSPEWVPGLMNGGDTESIWRWLVANGRDVKCEGKT